MAVGCGNGRGPASGAAAARRGTAGAGGRRAAGPGRPDPTATVRRIAAQLRADPRTVALVLVVPALLLTLLYYVFSDVPVPPGRPSPFGAIGPIMLAVLPMMLMFIVTSVVMLRERRDGTLERILTTPLHRTNLIVSYAVVFGGLAVAQTLVLAALILGPMDADLAGPWTALILVAFLDGLVGVAFGLLASAFAGSEFQAVQFMPVFIGPQLLLCGLFVPTGQMPDVLGDFSRILPMTWAVDVVRELLADPSISGDSWLRIGLLTALVVAVLAVASVTMPRATK
ncbi:ABC transporter permease [Corynebacterium sp. 335C]